MNAVLLIQMLSAAVLGGVVAVWLAARVGVGVFLILVAYIANTLAAWVPVAEIAGARVYAADGVFGLLALAYFFRLFRRRAWTVLDLLWITFGACILVSWVRGVGVWGLNSATNGLRDFFYFWVGTAYVASFEWRPRDLSFLHRCWLGTSFLLFFIMMSRYYFPIYAIDLSFASEIDLGVDRIFEGEQDFVALRVLTTSGALFLAQTGLLSLIVASRTSKLDLNAMLAPLWFALVVILQHRTVWVMTILCVLALLPSLRLRSPHLVAATAGAAALATGVTIWAAISSGDSLLLRSLSGAVGEVSNVSESTFSFRLQLWENYLNNFFEGSPLEYVFGQPFGTVVYSWIIVGRHIVFTDVFPHNFYVYCVYFTGALGLACVVGAYVLAIKGCWRLPSDGRTLITGREWSLFLVAQLVYSITYGLEVEQSIMIGTAMGLLANVRRHSVQPYYGSFIPLYARRPQHRDFGAVGAR